MSNMNDAFCKLAKLLDYPCEESREALSSLKATFSGFDFTALERTFSDLLRAQELYTMTFDMRERTTLYITFYYSGYTRDRGMDLLKLKGLLNKHGISIGNQAPDFLPVLLRLACSDREGVNVIAKYRQAIELIHKRLKDENNPYSAPFELLLTLVPESGDELKVKERPAVERVGIGDL